ncbi:MAG: terminase family protein [Nitrosarchaeum sp.]|nr:terminase family protein [Nitrosarchaeum sp.]
MFTEEHVSEFMKCKDDPVYFINNYVKFDHFKDGLTGIKLYEPQEKLINKYHNNRFNILKAPIQIAGKSSTAIFYILHQIIFQNYENVGIFSHHQNPSIHLLDRLKVSYENLPKWMQHGIIKNNRTTFELENGSRVIASSISPYNNAKGQSFSLILLDEIGYISYTRVEDFFDYIFPVIVTSKFTKVIINSTKDYYEKSYFNKIWKDSEDGNNDFVRTIIKWYEIPGASEEWKERMIASVGIDIWNREYECESAETLDTTPK